MIDRLAILRGSVLEEADSGSGEDMCYRSVQCSLYLITRFTVYYRCSVGLDGQFLAIGSCLGHHNVSRNSFQFSSIGESLAMVSTAVSNNGFGPPF